MKIILITPAPPQSRAGNRATATRWARILRELGHKVTTAVDYNGKPYDMMIALHAWRSAGAVKQFHEHHPGKPLIVALTGTDLYRFIHSHPEPTLRSIELADRLVALHALAHRAIPESTHHKLHIIYQSAKPISQRLRPTPRFFDICVAGHLRDEKDSLRTAFAVRDLPASSRIRVLHYGKAHNNAWAERAENEMQHNPRYRWFGERPHGEVRKAYARCRAMVLSSVMEGGANVISEACVAGLPVIASEIDGSVGLLGEDYPGYYPAQDTAALSELLLKAENEPQFLTELKKRCVARAALFTPEQEAEGWRQLLADL